MFKIFGKLGTRRTRIFLLSFLLVTGRFEVNLEFLPNAKKCQVSSRKRAKIWEFSKFILFFSLFYAPKNSGVNYTLEKNLGPNTLLSRRKKSVFSCFYNNK